jgi:hypothetical protein
MGRFSCLSRAVWRGLFDVRALR